MRGVYTEKTNLFRKVRLRKKKNYQRLRLKIVLLKFMGTRVKEYENILEQNSLDL